MSERNTPRRRCVGYTPTTLMPAVGRSPPGTLRSNLKAPAPPTIDAFLRRLHPEVLADREDGRAELVEILDCANVE
jgi:hypothetical protein